MNGVDPEREDIATADTLHVSERLLHLSAAAALRQVLMSRPTVSGSGRRRRRHANEQVTLDAYYLALALVDAHDGDSCAVASLLSRDPRAWLPAAALVGRLQVRFLEQVCAQLEVTANHLAVPAAVADVPAAEALQQRPEITETLTLLPNHAAEDEADEGLWLHATSRVVIEGRAAPAIVDAGPSVLPVEWSARLAAPVTVTAADGRWPKDVVRDCLWMCEDAVRSWVASMSRQLRGDNNEDLLLGVGQPLRAFLVSPAAREIARVRAADTGEFGGLLWRVRPAMACADSAYGGLRTRDRVELLSSMRNIDDGVPLPAETVIPEAIALPAVRCEELALLSAVDPQRLSGPVEVTVNLHVPEWEDVTAMVEQLSAGQEIELTAPLLAWADRDIVSGDTQRLTIRARVHYGAGVNTPDGMGVFLAAGTRLSVLGSDISRTHCTVYLDQCHVAGPLAQASAPAGSFCVA